MGTSRMTAVTALRDLFRALGSWSYGRSAAAGKRDLRLDLLRGFCVFVMIVDHVGGETSWLYVLTGGDRFVVSAAEGFVLLSGISMGMVHHGVISRAGLRAMLAKVASRAGFLYVLTVSLTIAFAAASSVLGTPWAAASTPADSTGDFALSVLTLHRSYSLTDVLLLYTLLVLAAGPAIWLLSRGHTRLVLAASWAVWAARQLWPDRFPAAWSVIDGGFPFSAWQVMFFNGLVIGFHRERLARYLCPARLVALGAAAVVALVAIQLITVDLLALQRTAVDVPTLLFDKNDVRIGRVVALFGAASFAYAAVTVAWRPLHRATSWLLMPLGTRALFAYGVQLFVVAFFSSELLAPVRLDRENALFQASAVALVWLACRAQPRLAAAVERASATLARAPLLFEPAMRPAALALAGVVASGCVLAAPVPGPAARLSGGGPAPLVAVTRAAPAAAGLAAMDPPPLRSGWVSSSWTHAAEKALGPR